MSSCPFCFGTLLPTFTKGLPRERCGKCEAVWFEGEALLKVLGSAALDGLMKAARGKPGECKGCHGPLSYVPNCPQCGRDAPACPKCGTAPLSVAVVQAVKVDVCTGCKGVALDAGELDLLHKTAEKDRTGGLVDLKPEVEPQQLQQPQCSECRRKLKLQHAFTYDRKLYCGSCAPEGSAPYDMELAKAIPSLTPSVGRYLQGGMGWTSADPISYAIGWLFSKIVG
jgi:Zn-finger nucleic acid-binding protein